jgi:DNA repair exonuclease SbcCD ATPase subunit
MDAISLAGAYQGLKAAKDILTTLFDAKVDAEAKHKILEAQGKLGEVQDALFVLRERLSELQQERDELKGRLSNAEAWQTQADQYELTTTPGTAVVYKYKGQPDHFACPSCFNKHEVHILQDNKLMRGTYRCTGCEANYPVKPPSQINPAAIHRLSR